MKIYKFFLFILILFYSCNNSSENNPVNNENTLDSLAGTRWVFYSFKNKSGIKHLLSDYTNANFTLNFINDYASGRSGCNSYSISYKITSDSIYIQCCSTTKVYCTLTGEYFFAILKSSKYKATESDLTLFTTDNIMTKMYFKNRD